MCIDSQRAVLSSSRHTACPRLLGGKPLYLPRANSATFGVEVQSMTSTSLKPRPRSRGAGSWVPPNAVEQGEATSHAHEGRREPALWRRDRPAVPSKRASGEIPQREWCPPRVSPAASTAPRAAPSCLRKIPTGKNSFRPNSSPI